MEDPDDIFGKDIKDSSHLQIISSDEEDVASPKSHESPKAKTDSKANSPTEKGTYYDEKFDRHLRLDKTVESNLNADTQNIIDEINKIFEKSETSEEPEEAKSPNLLEKGKQVITDLTQKIASGTGELLTPKAGRPDPVPERKRTRSNRKICYRFDSDLEDISGYSSPSVQSHQTDDDDYEPGKGVESTRKTPKKKSSKGSTKPKRGKRSREPVSEGELSLGDSKSFDNFGFDRATSLQPPAADDFLNLNDDSGDMICLKFAVVDQNRNVINDSRLDCVFIRTTETLGNIAKKIGEMYQLGAEYHHRIRVIIDGETQDHDLQIGRRSDTHRLPGTRRRGEDADRHQVPPEGRIHHEKRLPPEIKGPKQGWWKLNIMQNLFAHEPPEVVEID